MLAKRWIITECAKEQREDLSQALGVSEYIAEILLKRGIDSFAAAQEFLNMGAAAEKIWQAIDDKKKIRVYGDYDVDGMCASAILYEGLKDLGAEVDVYVPDRIEEGYGLNEKAVEKIYADGTGLLVTVEIRTGKRLEKYQEAFGFGGVGDNCRYCAASRGQSHHR